MNNLNKKSVERAARINETIKKMADHENCVELVNSMYGSHPDNEGTSYFVKIYGVSPTK